MIAVCVLRIARVNRLFRHLKQTEEQTYIYTGIERDL